MITSSTSPQPMSQISPEFIQQIISALPNVVTHASVPWNTSTTSNVGCLGISQAPTQPMAIPTQPTSSPQLHVPTTMVTTSMPNATSTYQHGGSNGTTPPLQQPQVQANPKIVHFTQMIHDLQNQMYNMNNKGTKNLSFDEICPFAKSTPVTPFPTSFEILKFDKYTGETCPITYLKKFSVLCQEVAYSDDYLKRLFPRSLGGPAFEWFMNLPKGSYTTFNDLANKFIAQYSYNTNSQVSLSDLCNTKQWHGENFANFLQRWRHHASRIPYKIEDSHLVDIFIKNLVP